jgi:hypothetical protein
MENVTIAFIEWLHQETSDCKSCTLVLDMCPRHQTKRIIAATEENDMELLFVLVDKPTDFSQWTTDSSTNSKIGCGLTSQERSHMVLNPDDKADAPFF